MQCIKTLPIAISLLAGCSGVPSLPVDAGLGDAAAATGDGGGRDAGDTPITDAAAAYDGVPGQETTYTLTWECMDGCGIAGSGAPLAAQDRLTASASAVRFWRTTLPDTGYSGPAERVGNEIHVSSLDTSHTYEPIVITVEAASLRSCIAWTGYPGPENTRRAWCLTGQPAADI